MNESKQTDDPIGLKKPWKIEAGTVVQNADGKTILCCHEASEGFGGDFRSIRKGLEEAVRAVNEHAALCAVAEAATALQKIQIPSVLSTPEHGQNWIIARAELDDALAALAQVRKESR